MVVAVVALAGFASACGGSSEPAKPPQASKSATANAGAATPKTVNNSNACGQAARLLRAGDQVSENHANEPVVRVGLYRLLAQQLTSVAQNADGDVNQSLTAIVSLLSKAGSEAATNPGNVRGLAKRTDPEFQKLRGDLARACDTAQ
jgi:hypothetical protein